MNSTFLNRKPLPKSQKDPDVIDREVSGSGREPKTPAGNTNPQPATSIANSPESKTPQKPKKTVRKKEPAKQDLSTKVDFPKEEDRKCYIRLRRMLEDMGYYSIEATKMIRAAMKMVDDPEKFSEAYGRELESDGRRSKA